MVAKVGGTASSKQQSKTHTLLHTLPEGNKSSMLRPGSNKQKMLLGFVILSLLFSSVTSLKCYVCSSSTTNTACNQNNQECQAPHDTCMTVVDTLGNMMAIVKQCSSRATCNGATSTASVDSNGNGNTVSCCSGYNYCNKSGAGSVHTHPALLLLTAGLLLLWAH